MEAGLEEEEEEMKSCIVVDGLVLKVLWFIYLWAFLFVLFYHSTDNFLFVIEFIEDGNLGVIILLQDKIKSQGLVILVQFL